MIIATGESEPHPSVLPVDAWYSPALAPPTPVSGVSVSGEGTAGPVFIDTSGVDATGECAAAMHAGMAADAARRQFYEADIKPLASEYGITMSLPPVPEQSPFDPSI